MLRIIQNSSPAAAKGYYTASLSRGDYYSEKQEIVGRWGGLGAERLGLSGNVTKEAFDALCENRKPGREGPLTARTKGNRRVGWDYNFHAPKSISVLYALTEDPRILDAFRAAVADTMRELETETATRVRKGGKQATRTTGNLVFAEFTHLTARPVDGVPDPHLHSHNFVFNSTFDEEERVWKAADIGAIKRDAPYYEAAFHARFAGTLAAQGFAVERTAKGWEIAGIPESVIQKFSRRTAAIEALAEAKGITSAKAKDKLGATTRDRKREDLSLSELRELWAMRLSPDERQALSKAALGRVKAPPAVSAKAAMDYGVSHAFERASVVSEKTLMASALRHGVGSVTVEGVKREAVREGMISKEVEGQRLTTTREVLAEEHRLLAFAREGRGTCRPLGAIRHEFQRDYLNAGQRLAVRHVLLSPDRVIAIRGAAGVGKTTLMQEAVSAIEAGGHRVFVYAPSADASRGVLRKEGFKDAETVARLLQDERLQDQIKGNVLWLDEAGQLGSRTLGRVFDLAERHGARVVLSGDVRQHGAVERGDALRLLETHSGMKVAEVTEIQRQKGEYKAAVKLLSRGDVEAGLAKLDALGFVREIADDTRHRRLAADYLGAVKAGKTALVIAPTHREGEAATAVIREGLRAEGRIGAEERPFARLTNHSRTEAERSDALSYQAGDVVVFVQNVKGWRRGERAAVLGRDEAGQVLVRRASGDAAPLPLRQASRFQVYEAGELRLAAGDHVRITQNGYTRDRKHRLDNGAIHEVEGFSKEGDILLRNGWVVGRDYGHLAHGYATTSHAAQGKTVNCVFIAQGSEGFRAASREQLYVSASRAREQVTLYTDDKEALRSAVSRTSERMAASELTAIPAKGETSRQNRLRAHAQLVNRLGSVARAYAGQKLDDLRGGIGRMQDRLRGLGKDRREMGYER